MAALIGKLKVKETNVRIYPAGLHEKERESSECVVYLENL
jgi:hypothetical protein